MAKYYCSFYATEVSSTGEFVNRTLIDAQLCTPKDAAKHAKLLQRNRTDGRRVIIIKGARVCG